MNHQPTQKQNLSVTYNPTDDALFVPIGTEKLDTLRKLTERF